MLDICIGSRLACGAIPHFSRNNFILLWVANVDSPDEEVLVDFVVELI
ncbi:unnamed protein product, partial [Rotaria socialis]